MTGQANLAEKTEVSLILEDVKFFRNFALNDDKEHLRPIAAFALMPFLSAFVYESAAYFRRKGLLQLEVLKPHESLLRTSRLRLKLLDDDHSAFAEMLERSSKLASISSTWMFERHHGVLGPLKRFLQPDLGMYFVQGQIVSTTHTGFLNLGLTETVLDSRGLTLETLRPFLYETSLDLGRYLGLLLGMLKLPRHSVDQLHAKQMPPVEFVDLKSARLYGSIARSFAPGHNSIALLLTSILAQVNAARILTPLIAGGNEISAFKIGFVSLFHVASSLQKLLNEDRRDQLLDLEARNHIMTVLGSSSIRSVRKNRSLRNCLVHYGIDGHAAAKLSATAPLFGLIEAYSSGKSLTTIHDDVQDGLTSIATLIGDVLPRQRPSRQVL